MKRLEREEIFEDEAKFIGKMKSKFKLVNAESRCKDFRTWLQFVNHHKLVISICVIFFWWKRKRKEQRKISMKLKAQKIDWMMYTCGFWKRLLKWDDDWLGRMIDVMQENNGAIFIVRFNIILFLITSINM